MARESREPGPTLSLTKFGGLILNVDPSDVGWDAAVDLSNVDLDQHGEISTRDAFTDVVSVSATLDGGPVAFETSNADTSLVIIKRTNASNRALVSYTPGGTLTDIEASFSNTLTAPLHGARFGDDSGNEYVYLAAGLGTIWKYDGSAFASVTGSPDATLVSIWPGSNRLVANDGASKLTFSDQGDPETFSDNTLELTPGDDSDFTGLLSWQNEVFAFKRGRFFVFTSESELDDGTPVFNYYTADGRGSVIHPVAGPDGIYYFDGRSVWVTTGDSHDRLSAPIEPFLRGDVEIGGVALDSLVPPTLTYSGERLYFSFSTSAGGEAVNFVYDTRIKTWTVYSAFGGTYAFGGVVTLHSHAGFPLDVFAMFDDDAGTVKVALFDDSLTQDGGDTDIDWHYKTGYRAPADPYRITSRDATVWGTGSANLQLLTRGARTGDTADTGDDLTLGSTDPAPARRRKTVRGVEFAMYLWGTGDTSITRVVHTFRPPGKTRP